MRQFYLFFLSISIAFLTFWLSDDSKSDSTAFVNYDKIKQKQASPPKKTKKPVSKPVSALQQQLAGEQVNWVQPFAVTITAVKSVSIVTDNAPSGASPTDVLEYSILVSNAGSTDGTAVTFTDVLNSNLTLVPGSITATPIAVTDAYTTIGNVGIDVSSGSGLLANDVSPDGTALTATTTTDAATTDGGKITIAANGSFSYTPKTGTSSATDSYTYTLNSSNGTSTTGVINFTISGTLWFVKSDVASNGDGSLASPFKQWSDFGTANTGVTTGKPKTNEAIFVYGTGTDYTTSATVTLRDGQKIIGQGAGATLASIAGISVPTFSKTLPSTGGTFPNLTGSGGGVSTIALGSGNTLRGFNMGNATTDISGTNFGTLTASEMTLNGTGAVLNLTTGVLSATFASITSTNAASTAISLTSVTGSLTSTSGTTITNPTGSGINIATCASGTFVFNTTAINQSSATALNISGSGANITFGDLDIVPDNAVAGIIAATYIGTITNTTGSTIAATGATAIDISGTSSVSKATLAMVFTSVGSTNAAKGIRLRYALGSFTINGSGTTNGTGGIISGMTSRGIDLENVTNITLKNITLTNANTNSAASSSSDYSLANGAINLHTVTTIVLNNIDISGTTRERGINGFNVSALTLNGGSTITDCGDGVNEGCMYIQNLTGTCVISDVVMTKGAENIARIFNTGSSTLTLSIGAVGQTTTFQNTQQQNANMASPNAASAIGSYAFIYTTDNSSTGTATIDTRNTSFLQAKTQGFKGIVNNTSTGNFNIKDCTFSCTNAPVAPEDPGTPIDLVSAGNGIMNFNILTNTASGKGTSLINLTSQNGSTAQGRVNGNTITHTGTLSPVVFPAGTGINLSQENSSTLKVEIDNNTINNILQDPGIWGTADQGTGRLDMIVAHNTVNVSTSSTSSNHNILVQAGASGGTNTNVACIYVHDNDPPNPIGTQAPGGMIFRPRAAALSYKLYIQGTGADAAQVWNNNNNLPTGVLGTNIAQSGTWGTSLFSSTNGGAAATCNAPGNPTFSLLADIAPMPSDLEQVNVGNTRIASQEEPIVEDSLEIADNVDKEVIAEEIKSAINEGEVIEKKTNKELRETADIQSGETVTVNGAGSGFTLPAGMNTTIKFRATVSGAPTICNIPNTATISGFNFSNVTSNTTTTTLTIAPPTSILPTATTICNGQTVSLSASCAVGTVTWYNVPGGTAAPVGTGSPLIQSPSTSTTYYAVCTLENCESSRVASGLITVNPNPAAPTGTTNQTICSGTAPANLSASCATGTVTWYGSATGTAIATGTYNPGVLTNNTGSPVVNSYFAGCETGGSPNCVSSRTQVNITVNPAVIAPTGPNNPTICSGSSTNLTATCSAGTVTWYASATSIAPVGTGTYSTGVLTNNTGSPTTTNYFASCETGGSPNCASPRTTVTVTVNPNPTAPTGTTNQTICSGSAPANLSATCASGTVTWYGSATGTAIATGTYNPGVLTNNTGSPVVNSYFAGCESGGSPNCVSTRTTVTVTVNPNPAAPTGTTNQTICSGTAPANLSASCATGTVTWYGSATGTAIATGTYNPGVLTNNTGSPVVNSYFAGCETGGSPNCVSSRTQVNITVNPAVIAPTGPNNPTICSGSSTNLTATCSAGTVTWYASATSIAPVGTGTYSTGVLTNNTGSPTTTNYFASCETGGSPNCASPRTTVTVTVNPNPTAPTGTTNQTICSGSAPANLSATCASGTVTWYGSATGTAIATGTYNPGVLTNNTGSPVVNSYFAGCESGGSPNCVSTRTTVTVTVNPNPAAPTGTTNQTICSGTAPANLSASCATGTVTWYGSATGTAIATGTYNPGVLTNNTGSPVVNSYFAGCETGGSPNCVSSRTQVNITVNPAVIAPTGPNNPTICSGSSTNLTATCSAGTVTWYASATSIAPVGTGTYSTGVLTNNTGSPTTTNYFASCETGGSPNCASPRTTVTVTVNPNPTAPTGTTNQTICSGSAPANLSATCASGTVTWYGSATGTAIATGTYNPGVLTNNTGSPVVNSYFAGCESGGSPNCVSTRTTVTVTVNPNPAAPTGTTNQTICSGTAPANLSASCATGTVTWYGSATGTAIATGTYNPGVLTNNTGSPVVNSYFAGCETGGSPNCVSSRTQVNITVNPAVIAPTGPNNPTICSGSSTNLTATCSAGTVTWYASATSIAPVGTGTYSTGVLTNNTGSPTTTNYFASCETGGSPNCASPRTTVTVTVNPNPTAPTGTTNQTICSGSAPANLSATCASGTVTWYGSATGTAIATGTYNPGVLTNNTGSPVVNSYFAGCESGGSPNCVSTRTTVTVTVNPNPAAPTGTTNQTICSGTAPANLSASCATGTVTWYGSATGTAIATGTYNPGVLTNNTGSPVVNSYFAGCETGGSPNCVSSRTQVNITVNPAVIAPTGPNNPTICSGSSTNLTATCSAGTVTWYASATSIAPVGTGTYSTGVLTNNTGSPTTTNYFASCETGGSPNCASPRTTVTVTVNPNPTAPTGTTNQTICSGSAPANLSATCASGTVTWYGSATGTAIATGTYNPGVLTNNTGSPVVNSYFAGCESGGSPNCVSTRTTVTVTVNPNPAAPTGTTNQTICSGTAPANLSASCATGTVTWYGSATGTAIATGTYNPGVLTNNTGSPVVNSYFAGCETGGSPNCVSSRTQVNITVNPAVIAPTGPNNPTICSGSSTNLTATCSAGTVTWYASATSIAPVGTGTYSTGVLTNNTGSPTTTNYFASCETGGSPNCASPRTTVTVTVNPNPTAPTGTTNQTICSGSAPANLSATCASGTVTWYGSATGTAIATGTYNPGVLTNNTGSPVVNSYFAGCESGGSPNCVSTRTTVTVTVNPNPAAPTGTTNQTICSGTAPANLSASCATGTVTWYGSATGTAIATGTYNPGVLTNNTGSPVVNSYFAGCETGGSPNCVSSRTQVNITVNPNPAPPTGTANQTICSGFSTTLTATCNTGTVTWYDSMTATTALGTGSYNTGTLTNTKNYFVTCEFGGSPKCVSPRTPVSVTVNPNPAAPTGTSNQTICSGLSATLTANCTSSTITWYGSLTASTALGTGSYNTGSLTSTTHYFAACETKDTPNCVSSPRIDITITVNPNPTAPTGTVNQTICSGTAPANLSASCATGTVTWYGSATGTAIATGTYNPGVLTNNTGSPVINSYFAGCETGGSPNCVSTRTQVNITVKPNVAAPIGSNKAVCNGTSAALTATCTNSTVTWYASLSGTTVLGTGTYNTPNLTTQTDYYAACESGGSPNCVSSRTKVTVSINPQPVVSAGSNQTICSGTSATLTATCESYATSATLSGASQVPPNASTATGSVTGSFNSTTNQLSISVTFNGLVAAATMAHIHTGAADTNGPVTVDFTGFPSVTSGTYTNTFTLTGPQAASLLAGNMYVNIHNSTFPGGEIRGQLANICANNFVWNPGALSGQTVQVSPLSQTTYTVTATNSTTSCTNTASVTVNVNSTPTAPTGTSNQTICIGSSATLTATCNSGNVVWYGSATGTASVGTGTFNTGVLTKNVAWYGSATGTASVGTGTFNTGVLTKNTSSPVVISYFAACESGGSPNCVSTRTQVNITVNPNPVAPTGIANQTICSGFGTTLTATCATGTLTWYGSLTATTALGTGAYDTGNLTNTSSYFAACESGGSPNCVSARVQTTVTVNPTPNANASNTGPYTVGQTIELSATGGGTYSWVGPNNFTSNSNSPLIPNSSSVNGGIYTVTVTQTGCTATATTNVVVNGVDPCIRIVDYTYVKAGNPYQPLFALSSGITINQIPDQVTIMVVPVCNSVTIESFEMNIQGPGLNWNILQNVAPNTLFDNFGNNFNGRNFVPGIYTLTVTGYAKDNKGGGITYGPVITTFTVVGNLATISTPTLSTTNLCAGNSVDVTFTTTGTFDPSNHFEIQLSDANGSFASPVLIGTTTTTGTIPATIPLSTPAGSNYLIRVISSNPVLTGNPTASFITVNPASLNIITNIDSGTSVKKASQTITATNKVISPANVTYEAGKSVILNPGFESNTGTVFRAEIKGCNN